VAGFLKKLQNLQSSIFGKQRAATALAAPPVPEPPGWHPPASQVGIKTHQTNKQQLQQQPYLCLHSLAGIHQQQRSLAGSKAARHLQKAAAAATTTTQLKHVRAK
jgi:hypothetical protein